MNRRILLIDADPAFYATLSKELGRYRFEIVSEPDADKAIALGSAETPALIIVGVEEPDKSGFKVFQRCKKGVLSKVPIVLVTSSVTPESFGKHRGLKIHADEYLDKRSISSDEVLGKLDNLIGLGDAADDDDLDIPVEVDDDIPLSDGDMVLEEEVAADDDVGSFSSGDHRTGARVDSMVDAETDMAFAALLGDEAEPSMPPNLASGRHSKPTLPPDMVEDGDGEPSVMSAPIEDAAPEQAAADEPAASASAEVAADEAVPGMIHDGGLEEIEEEPLRSLDMIPVEELVRQAEADEIAQDAADEEQTRVPASHESSSAISIDVEDLQPIEEDSGGVPEPVPHPLGVEDQEGYEPPARPSRPKFIEAATQLEPHSAEPVAPEPPAPAPEPPARSVSGVHAIVDLGLDVVAEDANREQSGVYDRRALRKIGELERQIAQLKTEVERVRASADTASRGPNREREFLNLREQITSKDKELKRAADAVAMRDHELGVVQEQLHETQKARTALEAKSTELEQRAKAESSRLAAVETKERALAAQLAALTQELATKSHAAEAAEVVRAQLERDVASERAMRASGASEAERSLRVEREQMIARHQGELANLRNEAASAQIAALAALRLELEAAQAKHASEQAALRAEHQTALAERATAFTALQAEHQTALADRATDITALQAEHASALSNARTEQQVALSMLREELEAAHAGAVVAAAEASRQEVASEADQAVSQLESQHAAEVKRLADAHATAMARIEVERDAAIARTKDELETQLARAEHDYTAAMAKLRDEHTTEVARVRDELGGQVAASATARDRAVAELQGEIARLQAALETAEAAHTQGLAETAASHAAALAEQAQHHNDVLAKRDREHALVRNEDAAVHGAALSELKIELERQAAAHGVTLDVARRELDQMIEQHELAKGQVIEEQRLAAEALAREHADELRKVADDKQRAIDEIQRAAAEHRTAIERAAEQHREELAQQKDVADREAQELRAALHNAKRAMEEAAAKHQAEREEADKAGAQAIAEQTALHERALAVANGEIIRAKAVDAAEHNRAMAAKDAEHKTAMLAAESEHTKVLREVTAERDEVKKGLSSSRDAHKRTEGELATAVQTIADRNAELRSHVAAIAERDLRIGELRKEIESLELENANYQEQVLRAYQKIKTDEAMVARAKKAMAIALTVLDDQGTPKES